MPSYLVETSRKNYTLLRILSITTGLLLLPTAYISILSGVCLRIPGLVETITIGLLDGYPECSYLHLQILPIILSTLAIIHTIATIELLYPITSRDNRLLVLAYNILRITSWILIVQVIITTIAYYIT